MDEPRDHLMTAAKIQAVLYYLQQLMQKYTSSINILINYIRQEGREIGRFEERGAHLIIVAVPRSTLIRGGRIC